MIFSFFSTCSWSLSQQWLHSRNIKISQHFLGNPYFTWTATRLRNGRVGCRQVFSEIMFVISACKREQYRVLLVELYIACYLAEFNLLRYLNWVVAPTCAYYFTSAIFWLNLGLWEFLLSFYFWVLLEMWKIFLKLEYSLKQNLFFEDLWESRLFTRVSLCRSIDFGGPHYLMIVIEIYKTRLKKFARDF